jgi:hypothetical protein
VQWFFFKDGQADILNKPGSLFTGKPVMEELLSKTAGHCFGFVTGIMPLACLGRVEALP